METKKNRFLFDYVWEIFKLSGANGVDIGVGRDMFCTNLSNYGVEGAEFYEGADVNYAVASQGWKEVDQAGAKIGYRELTKDEYKNLTQAYSAGDKDTFQSIIDAYVLKED